MLSRLRKLVFGMRSRSPADRLVQQLAPCESLGTAYGNYAVEEAVGKPVLAHAERET
jgi:hypothetical protein